MRGYDKYRVTPDLIGDPYPVPRHPRLDRAYMPPELSPQTRSGVQLLVVLDTRMRGYDRPFVMSDLIGGPYPQPRHPRLDRGSMYLNALKITK
jgi:hypothetical protein